MHGPIAPSALVSSACPGCGSAAKKNADLMGLPLSVTTESLRRCAAAARGADAYDRLWKGANAQIPAMERKRANFGDGLHSKDLSSIGTPPACTRMVAR
eukprot:scaffold272693_cov35-Tisochrysis_lutea.AAC.2